MNHSISFSYPPRPTPVAELDRLVPGCYSLGVSDVESSLPLAIPRNLKPLMSLNKSYYSFQETRSIGSPRVGVGGPRGTKAECGALDPQDRYSSTPTPAAPSFLLIAFSSWRAIVDVSYRVFTCGFVCTCHPLRCHGPSLETGHESYAAILALVGAAATGTATAAGAKAEAEEWGGKDGAMVFGFLVLDQVRCSMTRFESRLPWSQRRIDAVCNAISG